MSDTGICAYLFNHTVCVAPAGHSGPHITSNDRFPHGLDLPATPGGAAEPPCTCGLDEFKRLAGVPPGGHGWECPKASVVALQNEIRRLRAAWSERAAPPETAALVGELRAEAKDLRYIMSRLSDAVKCCPTCEANVKRWAYAVDRAAIALAARRREAERIIAELRALDALRWTDNKADDPAVKDFAYRCVNCDAWEDQPHEPACIVGAADRFLSGGGA